jgi:hypothetical protein
MFLGAASHRGTNIDIGDTDGRWVQRLVLGDILAVALALLLVGIGLIGQREERVLDYGDIRSVTFYVFPFEEGKYLEELERSLPSIKETGFNTIWIVNPWHSFNPEPLSDPPVYDASRFKHLLCP